MMGNIKIKEHKMFIPTMILRERTKARRGSVIAGRNGALYECTHYDSKDTVLYDLEFGKVKFAKTMTLHRYYETMPTMHLVNDFIAGGTIPKGGE